MNIHGYKTSAMEWYCIGTMKGSDGRYYSAICARVNTPLIPLPVVRCGWELVPTVTLEGVVDGLTVTAVRFFYSSDSVSLVYI